jgi:hypothetical protein
MPPSSRLQKWQTNAIYEAIESVALNPKEFDWNDTDAEVRIKHKWSASYFIIGGNSLHYKLRYLVGDGPELPSEAYTWQGLMERITGWLQQVKRDLETPDLWADLRRDGELLEDVSNETTQNTQFTTEEQTNIEVRLRELAEDMKRTHSLSQEQMRALDTKIDYLIEASSRIGRKDWILLSLGVVATLASAFPPEFVRQFLQMVIQAIGHHGLLGG